MIEAILRNKETGEEIMVEGKCFFGGMLIETEEMTGVNVVGIGDCKKSEKTKCLAAILARVSENKLEDLAVHLMAGEYREQHEKPEGDT